MRKRVLAVTMAAVAVLFALEIFVEQMFISRRRETAATMADEIAAATAERPEVYAVFGVDTAQGDAGRSDCILLICLDESQQTVRMCSLARDTMVTIPGENIETKLGHAYAMGGPEMAMDTIRENFGVEVTEYVTVNFSQMAEIVELLGGVEVPLSQEEWRYLGLDTPYLGQKRLDGTQTLRYCRIRAIDSDDVRTARQRTVIAAMLTRLRTMPRSRLPELVTRGLSLCRTNLSLGQVLHLGRAAMSSREGLKIQSMAIPGDAVSAWGGVRSDGVWYYVYDLIRASEVIETFFFGDSSQQVAGEI